MALNIGDTIGAYQIIEQIGQGGMATVYKAYHAALDRSVAIKVLHAALNTDSTFLARFQREARVVAKLEHPNIVPVYDYAEYQGSPYLVMKFIEGLTLRARLAFGPLAAGEARRVIGAVAAALDYAHRQGILHRDVKPSNIMLARDGGLYLADFGLARIAQAGESTLSADSMLGTPAYMSPEQARGVKDLDARADIYSLGVVAYELAVGRVPFVGDTTFSVVHDHIFTPPPAPRRVNPNVSEAVEQVLLKALAKDRDQRYPDVAAFAAAFDQAASGPDTTAARQAELTRVEPVVADPTLLVPGAERTLAQKPAASAPARTPIWVWLGLGTVTLIALAALLVAGLLLLHNQGRGTAATTPTPPTSAQATSTSAAALLAAAGQAFDNRNSTQGFTILDQAVRANPADPVVLLQSGDIALEHGAQFAQPSLDRYYLPAVALDATRRVSDTGLIQAHAALAMYALAQDPNGGAYLTGLESKLSTPGETRLFLDRWQIFEPSPDFAAIQTDLAGLPRNVTVRLVSGDLLLAQGKSVLARAEYAAVTDEWRPANPIWVLLEAQCEIGNLNQNRASATAKPLCNPIGDLVKGR